MKIVRRLLVVILIVFSLSITSLSAYSLTAYQPLEEADTYLVSDDQVTIFKLADGTYVFAPTKIKAGFIFYPGGNVDYKSYAPLMYKLSSEGYLCLLPQMPYNLAIFKKNVADALTTRYIKIKQCI